MSSPTVCHDDPALQDAVWRHHPELSLIGVFRFPHKHPYQILQPAILGAVTVSHVGVLSAPHRLTRQRVGFRRRRTG